MKSFIPIVCVVVLVSAVLGEFIKRLGNLYVYYNIFSFPGQNCANPKFTNIQTVVTSDSKLNTETVYTVNFSVDCDKNAKVNQERKFILFNNFSKNI